jgi:LPS export ABC transporter permease LptF/LPS export ABC transporter permease LptG
MSLTSRNVLREIRGPFLIGLGAYTFMLVLRSLLQLSELVVRRGLRLSLVAQLVLLTLPQVVVLTIPMAFLFGTLIALGRLSADSELIALQASGVSKWALYRPVLIAGGLLSLVVGVLSLWGYPAANDRLARLETDLFASAALEQIHPRTFAEPREDWLFLADRELAGASGWQGIFLDDRSDPSRENLIVAPEGRFRFEPDHLWLDLSDSVSVSTDARDPTVCRLNQNRLESILLRERVPGDPRRISFEKGLRLQTVPELLRSAEEAKSSPGPRYRMAWVEIHKKFAIPLACLVFALVALPFGAANRRGGKGSGFAISIGIVIGYYVLLNSGEEWAEQGRMSPALAMWLPNLLLLLLGITLALRHDEERQSLMTRLQRWRNEAFPRVFVSPARERRLRRRALFSGLLRFPASLDRYVLAPFFFALTAVYGSVAFLYVLIDYTDHLDDILKRHIPRAVVVSYYKALLPPIFVQILPYCLMIAALVALGSLSRTNEDTAFKACGVPLLRLGAGILFVALVGCGASYLLGEYVLPAANRRSNELLDRLKGRDAPSRNALAGSFWILGAGGRVWNFDSFDPGRKVLFRPSVYERDDGFRMSRRISAEMASWNGSEWVFRHGWVRSFKGASESSFERFESAPLLKEDPPGLFSQERIRPEEMPYRALERYIARLKSTGYPVASLATALASKPAVALQPLVLAFLAIPFGFSIGKRGTLTGIGFGLASGMVFLFLSAVSTKLGEIGSLPPHLAAWFPNLSFLILGGSRLVRART